MRDLSWPFQARRTHKHAFAALAFVAAAFATFGFGGRADADPVASVRALASALSGDEQTQPGPIALAVSQEDLSALGLTREENLQLRLQIAEAFLQSNRAGDAVRTLLDVLRDQEAALGPTSFELAPTLRLLASAQSQAGDLQAARIAIERVIALEQTELGRDHPSIRFDLDTLAGIVQRLASASDPSAGTSLRAQVANSPPLPKPGKTRFPTEPQRVARPAVRAARRKLVTWCEVFFRDESKPHWKRRPQ